MQHEHHYRSTLGLSVVLSVVLACQTAAGNGETSSSSNESSTGEATTGESSESGGPLCEEPSPCDTTDDSAMAIGLGCQGPDSEGLTLALSGADESIAVLTGLPGTTAYDATSGDKVLALTTGWISDLSAEPGAPGVCNRESTPEANPPELPAAVNPMPVAQPMACLDEPSLVGTGDCSGTLWEDVNELQTWTWAADLATVTVAGTVPAGASSLSLDLAFLTCEYPDRWWAGRGSHDLAFVWLESENWTGNIVFDEAGVSLTEQSEFFTRLDSVVNFEKDTTMCPLEPEDCIAPELKDTLFDGHGATPWLRVEAPVVAGAEFQLIIGIFDKNLPEYDAMLLIDRFAWSCDEVGLPKTSVISP